MKDFDFEELDRAVHSVTSPADEPAHADTPGLVSPPEPTPEPNPSPAARRTTGRFMDVMHPSADMRQSSPIAPRMPTPTTLQETPAPEEPRQHEEPESPQSPFIPDAVVEKRPLGVSEPLDLFKEPEHELLEETTEVQNEPVEHIEEPIVSAEVTDTHQAETPEAPASPLYDTEVYHPPAPQVKKKSGVWVFVWILVLILLGALSGAGVYFFVLPLL